MSMSLYRNPLALALAAVAATEMPALGAELLPEPNDRPRFDSIAGWLTRNNRRPRVKLRRPSKSQLNQRLAPATGPGSYGEWKKALAAERAAKRAQL